jgi:solute carrier family 25 uncoupling protein 8/9
MSKKTDLTLFESMAAGGLASCFAEICTIPMDTVKVRMQNFQDIYRSMRPTYGQIFAEEGFFAFYRGISAGLLRQITFASMRLGIYDFGIQELENKGVDIHLMHQVSIGLLSGGFSIAVANPFDVLKVKFQSDIVPTFKDGKMVGLKRNYSSLRNAIVKIPQTEGIYRGFYLSLWPNIMRNSIVNAIELVTFTRLIHLFRYLLFLFAFELLSEF